MGKRKTLVMYRVCITKRPREIYDRFLNKVKWHSQRVLLAARKGDAMAL